MPRFYADAGSAAYRIVRSSKTEKQRQFRARAEKAGTGYQTMMNDALRRTLAGSDQPVTEKTLREVLRQEMAEYLRGASRKR